MVVILVPPVCARVPCDRCLGHNDVLHTLAAGCPVRCSRAHARHCLVYPSQCLFSIQLVSYDTHGMWAVESKSDTSGVKPSALRPWQPHSETHVNITMSRLAGMREDRKVQMVQQDRPLFGHGSRTPVMFLQHVAR